MRLPGCRYQEHGWERVRKLLVHCSLPVLRVANWTDLLALEQQEAQLDWYTEALALALHQLRDSSKCRAQANSDGDSVAELAQVLLCELRALPQFWNTFLDALRNLHATNTPTSPAQNISDALLGKKLQDMYAGLRDKVDADGYQVATGQACSANKIYTWRMLDRASHEISRIFANWPHTREQVEAILGRSCPVQPIEVARLKQGGVCQAQWLINWSASLPQFRQDASPGPLHTKSKRFASLKNQPDKIQSMLEEISNYESFSHTIVQASYQQEAGQASLWLEDYWRVIAESEQAELAESSASQADELAFAEAEMEPSAESDLLSELAALQAGQMPEHDVEEEFASMADEDEALENLFSSRPAAQNAEDAENADDGQSLQGQAKLAQQCARLLLPGILHSETKPIAISASSGRALCQAVSLPPNYLTEAQAAEDQDSLIYLLLAHESLGLRLAVYLQLLGADDDSYPACWRDPRTGILPTNKQLAGLAQVSLPTLRKHRAQAIQSLQAQAASCIAAQKNPPASAGQKRG